jgi:hypothetical protein
MGFAGCGGGPREQQASMLPPGIVVWSFRNLYFQGFGDDNEFKKLRRCQDSQGQNLEMILHTLISLSSNCAFKARVERAIAHGHQLCIWRIF